jgi:uncharacterized Zn finger protein
MPSQSSITPLQEIELGWYEPTRRREAKGGIKAQTKSGSFGKSWWAKRWIETLESFDIGSRLSRGRSYARSGQVLTIDIEAGLVTATVQGSRPTPYRVTIKVKTLLESEWNSVAESLSSQVLYAAKLMAGEMPDTIEEAFKGVGLSLFPASLREIATDCSCPDWSNPCKHVAAVFYLLGEEFDRDPFLMFRLRGITRDVFTALLGRQSGSNHVETMPPPKPLNVEASEYWLVQTLPEDLFGDASLPPVTAALPRRLGNFPFWRGEEPLLDLLAPLYNRASRVGLDTFVGELGDNE